MNLANLFERENGAKATERRSQEPPLGYFRQVIAWSKDLAAIYTDDPTPTVLLALGHYRLGLFLERTGRQSEAYEAYGQAADWTEKLLDLPPATFWGRNLAKGLFAHAKGIDFGITPRDDAEPLYRRSIDLLERLSVRFPTISEYRQYLIVRYNSFGDLLKHAERLDEAEKNYRKAIDASEELIAHYPGIPDHKQSLAFSYSNLAELLASQGRTAEAENAWRQTLQLQERLIAEAPSVPAFHRASMETRRRFEEFLDCIRRT